MRSFSVNAPSGSLIAPPLIQIKNGNSALFNRTEEYVFYMELQSFEKALLYGTLLNSANWATGDDRNALRLREHVTFVT
jgi:hypothetical protein